MAKKSKKEIQEVIKEQVAHAVEEILHEVDVDELNAEAETLPEETHEGAEPEVTIEVMNEEEKPVRCVGVHPITGEKVYR